MTIGEELRAYRQSQGLTLAQMGERLDSDKFHLSRVEKGRSPMPPHWLAILPQYFDALFVADQVERARVRAMEQAMVARSDTTVAQ